MKQLNLEFSVPSPRKAPKGEVAAQLVLDQIAADPAKRRGTGSVQSVLAVHDTPLPRFVMFYHSPDVRISLIHLICFQPDSS